MNLKKLKSIIIGFFIAVPFLSSIISTIHLVDMYYLGNPSWISYTLAVSIEIGSLASFLTLSILSKLNKSIVWLVFIILFVMQMVGNVYFTYDWISNKIADTPTWLNNFKEMLEFFVYSTIPLPTVKMILSLVIGIPIPLISVLLLKSLADYVGDDSIEPSTAPEVKSNVEPEPTVEPEPEVVEEQPRVIDIEKLYKDAFPEEEQIQAEEPKREKFLGMRGEKKN